ncbi:MAG: xanthine dehydrogenase family protein subunit M [Chromatiales bacterium]|jgi:aerobic carbon-monoxide dehydrogenase medium subunit|nr:xanthine dehydrogenase family protein subunit M [Chromatiales bacterium]
MNPFHLETPSSLDAALECLETHGEDAKAMAGGTGLINLMKQRLAFPNVVVSLHQVPGLKGVQLDAGVVRVGALTRLSEVEANRDVQQHLPMLCEALAEVASPRIRAMATLGGAVAHGDPHQDTPVALMALNAWVVVRTVAGERRLALDDLYLDYYETSLAANELITHIEIPLPSASSVGVYLKFLPRSAEDYATVAVGLQIALAESRVADCSMVLGSVSSTPLRAHAAQGLLAANQLTDQLVRAAGEHAAAMTDPISDTRGTALYKRRMTSVFVRRAVWAAAAKLGMSVEG